MTKKVTVTLLLLGKLGQRSLAAPAGDNGLGFESLEPSQSLEQISQLSLSPFRSSLERPRTMQANDIETLLLSPPRKPSSTTMTPPELDINPLSFSYSKARTHMDSASSNEPYAKTVTVTEEVPTTITVSANPVTVTEILLPPPPTPAPNSPSRTSAAGLGPAKSIWLAPPEFSDLSAFGVSKFTGGQKNLEFVDSIPSEAKAPDEVASLDDCPSSTTLLQLLFPEGSINPGRKPQGGAEFYASPIDVTSARNVTLQYSVFFPMNFDFVLAGKLPGLYGGHTGCSGGDPAVDCFSTRLMWREGGAGELYLYAPKNQSAELCKAEGSVCHEVYGFSIGRGSFTWKTGDWTTIRQTVFLNTPGEQDGIFILDVDGKTAISRHDILYRDDSRKEEEGSGKGKAIKQKTATKQTKTMPTTVTTTAAETPTNPGDDDGGFLGLGPLLSSLLGGMRREVDPTPIYATSSLLDDHVKPLRTTTVADASSHSELVQRTPIPKKTQVPESSSKELSDFEKVATKSSGSDVTLVGIFFSTFFGGHDDKYATPRDQFVWFKDFGVAYNS